MAASGLAVTALILDAVWFGAGFTQFALKARRASYGLVRKDDASAQGRLGIAGSLRFLGGLNLALAAMSVMTLLHLAAYPPTLLTTVFLTAAIAHASQFAVNLPFAVAEARQEAGPWRVLGGLMLIIFVGDGVLTVVNLAAAVA